MRYCYLNHPLENLSWEIAKHRKPSEGEKWTGPLKKTVGPVADAIAKINKKVIKAIATGKCHSNSTLEICDQQILNGGFLDDLNLSDQEAGAICVSASLLGLYCCLYFITADMNYLIKGSAEKILKSVLDCNPYLPVLIGCALTILVQSSSITTSILTPLGASGILTFEQMYAMIVGANFGTCITGFLAAIVASSKPKVAMQVALSHLGLNTAGFLTFYPVPYLRKIPVNLARRLGDLSEDRKWFPPAYAFVTFVVVPGMGYAISTAID